LPFMNARAGWCTPMLHVADVERSIRFYRLLGFELVRQGILLILYTADLGALREQLAAAGEKPSLIEHPPWMPSGTIFLRDPDGYGIGINQWGDAEHDAWLKQLEAKRAAGRIP